MPIRTGAQYLESLRDDRTIMYRGERVDVTRHAAFEHSARAVAQFYDFQNLPAARDVMTYATTSGERVGMAFREAHSKDDMRARAAAYAAWAEVSCGFLGRSPDYMNTCMAALASVAPHIAKIDRKMADRARALYERARSEDLCLTHTFVDPFKIAEEGVVAKSASFRVVRETADGLVLRGARALATLAPFSNFNFNLGIPPILSHDGIPLSCSFVIAMNAPSVHWICRDALDAEALRASRPLASRCDEMDCIAIFDDCLVPWENVFAYFRGLDLIGMEAPLRASFAALHHQTIVRDIAKLRFIFGLGHLLAESSKVNQFINVKVLLGELAESVTTMEAFAIAAVEGAERDPVTGIYSAPIRITRAAVIQGGQFYSRGIDILLELGASRHVSTPHEETLEKLGDAMEIYFRANCANAAENVALCRLAWDVVGTSWGVRQNLYERFHFGDRTLLRVATYNGFNKEDAVEMVRRMLRPPTADERFSIPKKWCSGQDGR